MDAEWRGRDGHNSGQVDAAIAATHMMMTACDEGPGTCWVRGFDKDEVALAFGLPGTTKSCACCFAAILQRRRRRSKAGTIRERASKSLRRLCDVKGVSHKAAALFFCSMFITHVLK